MKTKTVCVTGASGFLGAHIVNNLLDAGYRVRGTVRDPENAEKYGFLEELDGADERLTLHRGELTEQGSFDEAVAGCDFVIHSASPVALDVDDPMADLVEPAVDGTKNVLAACKRAESVERVVFTSSMAAVTDERDHGRALDESDWNDTSSLARNPYFFSKTRAEKAAWTMAEDANFDLVVINPDLIAGPALGPSLNMSRELFVDILSGEFPAVIDLTWAIVDVRDVAEAHRRALESPTAAGRHICVEHKIRMRELVAFMRDGGYSEFDLPRLHLDGTLGTWSVRALSIFEDAGTRSFLKTHLGGSIEVDNAKIRESLSMQFRPLEQTLRDTLSDLEARGHLAA